MSRLELHNAELATSMFIFVAVETLKFQQSRAEGMSEEIADSYAEFKGICDESHTQQSVRTAPQ
jgi:hypothetical protein